MNDDSVDLPRGLPIRLEKNVIFEFLSVPEVFGPCGLGASPKPRDFLRHRLGKSFSFCVSL